jgi:lipoprotein
MVIMMRKRVFGLCVLIMSVFVLTACGGQNLDGKYYETFNSYNGNGVYLDKVDEPALVIKGKTLKFDSDDSVYSIDSDKKVIVGDGESSAYSIDGDILSIDDKKYVKGDTDTYKAIEEKADKKESYDFGDSE